MGEMGEMGDDGQPMKYRFGIRKASERGRGEGRERRGKENGEGERGRRCKGRRA
jgi:hypothetical protein